MSNQKGARLVAELHAEVAGLPSHPVGGQLGRCAGDLLGDARVVVDQDEYVELAGYIPGRTLRRLCASTSDCHPLRTRDSASAEPTTRS
jgi:hypothetical protein